MPPVGFEPTTPLFEQAETVHVLGPAAAVMGGSKSCQNAAVGNSACSSVCTCVFVCVPASQLLYPAVTDSVTGPVQSSFVHLSYAQRHSWSVGVERSAKQSRGFRYLTQGRPWSDFGISWQRTQGSHTGAGVCSDSFSWFEAPLD
jgi:hypothetical protein